MTANIPAEALREAAQSLLTAFEHHMTSPADGWTEVERQIVRLQDAIALPSPAPAPCPMCGQGMHEYCHACGFKAASPSPAPDVGVVVEYLRMAAAFLPFSDLKSDLTLAERTRLLEAATLLTTLSGALEPFKEAAEEHARCQDAHKFLARERESMWNCLGIELADLDRARAQRRKETAMNDAQIKHMVDRFLRWKLPENFNPDGGISFKRTFNEHTAHPMKAEPIGTNLFDATQAEAMVRFMVEGMP